MKAKDLKKELSKINKKHWDIIFANPKEYSKLYEKYISEIQELMTGFAKAKCKEQREICAKAIDEGWDIGDDGTNEYDTNLGKNAVLSASTPDFE